MKHPAYYYTKRKRLLHPKRERHRAKLQQRYRRHVLRGLVLAKYNNKCARCGYCEDSRALQIDHVFDDRVTREPHKGRVGGGAVGYLNKVLRDTEGIYQLLCANCNTIKRFEKTPILLKENK